jgi:hypothetical protein
MFGQTIRKSFLVDARVFCRRKRDSALADRRGRDSHFSSLRPLDARDARLVSANRPAAQQALTVPDARPLDTSLQRHLHAVSQPCVPPRPRPRTLDSPIQIAARAAFGRAGRAAPGKPRARQARQFRRGASRARCHASDGVSSCLVASARDSLSAHLLAAHLAVIAGWWQAAGAAGNL